MTGSREFPKYVGWSLVGLSIVIPKCSTLWCDKIGPSLFLKNITFSACLDFIFFYYFFRMMGAGKHYSLGLAAKEWNHNNDHSCSFFENSDWRKCFH